MPRARPRSLPRDSKFCTNEDVYGNLDGVLETIRVRLIELRPRIDESAI